MRQMVTKRLFTLLIIPMLLIPMTSLGVAHFTDSAMEKYKLHFAGPEIEIKDYKICAPCKWKHLITVSPPPHDLPTDTISISSKIFPCWYVWIGLVLHNQGCLPAYVKLDYEREDPFDIWQYFKHNEFYYGPYNNTEFEAVREKIWDNTCKKPLCVKPDKPPIKLNPCERLVLWIRLKFQPPKCWCCPRCFWIIIIIKITAELPELPEVSSWTWSPR